MTKQLELEELRSIALEYVHHSYTVDVERHPVYDEIKVTWRSPAGGIRTCRFDWELLHAPAWQEIVRKTFTLEFRNRREGDASLPENRRYKMTDYEKVFGTFIARCEKNLDAICGKKPTHIDEAQMKPPEEIEINALVEQQKSGARDWIEARRQWKYGGNEPMQAVKTDPGAFVAGKVPTSAQLKEARQAAKRFDFGSPQPRHMAKIDGLEHDEIFRRYENAMREANKGLMYAPLSSAQKNWARAEWSRRLKEKTKEAKAKERERVICDRGDDE